MKKSKRCKATLLSVMLAACMCLLAACGGGNNAGNGGAENAAENGAEQNAAGESVAQTDAADNAADLKGVTVLLDWTPNTNHTGLYVAKELGYYEEAGLNVTIQVPAEETATQLVGVGKGAFGISNTDDTLNALSLDDPMPIISVAAIIQHNTSGFVSLKDAGITSPADWGGKTYGGFGGAAEEKIIKKIAEDNGVDPESIRFVTLGNSDTLTALQNEIDFIWVFEAAELIGLDLQGAEYNYLPLRDYGDAFDYYTPNLIANTNMAKEDPEMVKAFLAATSKGYQYAIDEPDKAADILLKAAPELNEDLVRSGQEYLADQYAKDAPQWGYQDASVWENYAAFLNENGLLENEIDVTDAFTTEYLPQS